MAKAKQSAKRGGTKNQPTQTATVAVAKVAAWAPTVPATAPVFTAPVGTPVTGAHILAWARGLLGQPKLPAIPNTVAYGKNPATTAGVLYNIVVQPLANVGNHTTGAKGTNGQRAGAAPIPATIGYSGAYNGVRSVYQNWLLFGFGHVPSPTGAIAHVAHGPVFNLGHITASMHASDLHVGNNIICACAMLNGGYNGTVTVPYIQLRYVPLAQQPTALPPLTTVGAPIGTAIANGKHAGIVAVAGTPILARAAAAK